MITIKKPEDIVLLREGGRRLGSILKEVSESVHPGISASSLDVFAEKRIREGGDIPAFLNYRSKGSARAFPSSLCISVNDEVVHGLPRKDKILKEGDIVSLDLGLVHKNMYLDSAITVPVGKIKSELSNLLSVTREALLEGIDKARAGNFTGDIGYAIEHFIKPNKFGIVRELSGHGVGYAVHEDPFVPNYGKRGKGTELKPGMVIAIEPMVNLGSAEIYLDEDGFTYRTNDTRPSAHFEHTVLITEGDPEILTLGA